MLPSNDSEFLISKGFAHEVHNESGMICVLVKGLALPLGLNVATADLLLRLAPGYPDIPPDMWWFSPAIRRADGSSFPQTDVTESHLGQTWQRWSRHFDAGHWMAGIDSLESYFALIFRELSASARIAA